MSLTTEPERSESSEGEEEQRSLRNWKAGQVEDAAELLELPAQYEREEPARMSTLIIKPLDGHILLTEQEMLEYQELHLRDPPKVTFKMTGPQRESTQDEA
uniref:Uncharacterized protein n=1 Tax=Trichuris muris TaxID=70415 RepID=A0A5S6QN08_TRIMR